MRDKVVPIVGATGGIGSTLTRKLAEMRTKLVIAARDSKRWENLASSWILSQERPLNPAKKAKFTGREAQKLDFPKL